MTETILEIPLKGENYSLVDTLFVFEVSQTRKFGKHLIGLSDRINSMKEMTPEQFTEAANKLEAELVAKTDDSDEMMFNALERCYGLLPEKVQKLHYVDAAILFSEIYKASISPKKKLLTPSTLPSS